MDDPGVRGRGGGGGRLVLEAFGGRDGELGYGHPRWGLRGATLRREQGGLRLCRKWLMYSSLPAALAFTAVCASSRLME